VAEGASPSAVEVRAAELIAALSLATDLGIGVPLEYGLQSTLLAMRLAERLGVDSEAASETYYTCLLFYVGCTAGAEVAADLFGDDNALTTYGTPARFGSQTEMLAGLMRAVAPPTGTALVRAAQLAHGLPRLGRALRDHTAGGCEVAQLLSDRLGLPSRIGALSFFVAERWDGKGTPGHAKGEQIPLPVRIVHVARDAAFQRMLYGDQRAAQIVRDRAAGAFDPAIATLLADHAKKILDLDAEQSAWPEVLASEPTLRVVLAGDAIDRALAAIGDFADLACRYFVGHAAGVAQLAESAGRECGMDMADLVALRRSALVHDVGRVAVPVRIWQKTARLTPDEWERVRLHAYHTERILARSPFLAALAPIATFHHERVDGSGYHRGVTVEGLGPAARLLAAADTYHAMTEPRPHRPALKPAQAAAALRQDVQSGRLDADAAGAVLAAGGQPVGRIARPAGLSEREAEVVGLLARGLQTKQIARALGISGKTTDRHIQNAYRKIGVSTRAAATVFAMQHGMVAWGKLPISRSADHA
jgi:HD-GYP domain-containing protein (c-di-GMP phosphodiesterase class II)